MTPIFAAKEYAQGKETLFAVCDEDCLDKKYKEGKLSLHVDPGFYDGIRISEEEFAYYFRRCTIANLVGKKAVALAVELGFVNEANVITIDGTPHAQWALMFQ